MTKQVKKSEQTHYYTLKETSEKVGVSPDTVVRWRRTGLYQPRYKKTMGKLTVFLYDDDDITAMKIISAHTKPGRKPKKKVTK